MLGCGLGLRIGIRWKAWVNVQLMSCKWLRLTHLILQLGFGFEAHGNQHSGQDVQVERRAGSGIGVSGFETGLESHQEGRGTEERIVEGRWPSYGSGPWDYRSQWHKDYSEEDK